MEKIIIFGTGKRAHWIFDFINKYSGFEIVEIWDNDIKMVGNTYEINGKIAEVKSPYYQDEYNILVSSELYFEEISKRLIDEISINLFRIKRFNYIYNNFKREILDKYKTNNIKEINDICKYLKNNDLDVFCGQITRKYPLDMFDVYRDSNNGLLYSFWYGKKVYLSTKYNDEYSAKAYLCSLCIEQDDCSPHCYWIDKLDFDDEYILIDGGAAEGFFSLQIIDRVKHVYLVECDKDWINALRCTFEPYKDKVTIIEKRLDKTDGEETISLDTIISLKDNIHKFIVKMDIEGKETDAIQGMKKSIHACIDITCVICTYHKSGDEDRISDFFKNNKFYVSFTKGYMFFPYGEDIKPELRKGVLTAIRKN